MALSSEKRRAPKRGLSVTMVSVRCRWWSRWLAKQEKEALCTFKQIYIHVLICTPFLSWKQLTGNTAGHLPLLASISLDKMSWRSSHVSVWRALFFWNHSAYWFHVPCAPVHLACLGSTDTRVIFSLPLLYKMLQRRSFWDRVWEGGYLSAGLKGGCFSQGGLSFPSIWVLRLRALAFCPTTTRPIYSEEWAWDNHLHFSVNWSLWVTGGFVCWTLSQEHERMVLLHLQLH